MIMNSSSNNLSEVWNFFMCVSNCNKSKNISEDDIQNHNAPVKNSLRSYKLFKWENLLMPLKNCTVLSDTS